jgi:hypothetical protein
MDVALPLLANQRIGPQVQKELHIYLVSLLSKILQQTVLKLKKALI